MLTFLVLSLTSLMSQALPLYGFLSIENGQPYFIESRTSARMLIRPTKVDVIESLKKLSNYDSFQGQGEVNNNGELMLDSIDFVGLRSLIGLWSAEQRSIFEFQDFQKVLVYNPVFSVMTPRTQLQYSVAPSAGNEWRIFFTNENSVVLASLSLQEQRALLRFYNMDTGEVLKHLELTKVSKRN